MLMLPSCETRRAPLRIALNPWPGYEFLSLASEFGYFREEGVDVEVVEFSSLSDGRRAYERGLVDGLTGTLAELVIARDQSPRNPRVILVADYSNGADVVIARAGVLKPQDLKGKSLGVEPASLGMLMAVRLIEAGGLSLPDVRIVPTPQDDMEARLASGEIHAVTTYPPYSVRASKLPGAKVIFDSSAIPEQIMDVLAVDDLVASSSPGQVLAFRRAWARAYRYFESNRTDAVRRMALRERLAPKEFEEALAGIRIIPPDQQDRFLSPQGPVAEASSKLERVLLAAGAIGRH